jgi:Uma2 family endonuclease
MATVIPDRTDALAGQIEPDGLYEIIDGRIVEKTMGVYENWLATVIVVQLSRYAAQHPVGRALVETIFDLRPNVDRQRRPDVAFVSFDRWARDRGIPRTASWPVVPDLAVEVISTTNTADEVAEKIEEYFQVGVRLVWVVYPRQMKIYAYTSTTRVRILGPDDELDGADVLPGFRLPLRDLFDKAGEPAGID